jgi:hypothetical protein
LFALLLGALRSIKREARNKTLAMIMLASPAAAYVLNVLTPQQYKAFVFYVEAGGIFAFAAYWLTKSRELSLTQAEEQAVRGEVDKAELIDPKSKQQAAAS